MRHTTLQAHEAPIRVSVGWRPAAESRASEAAAARGISVAGSETGVQTMESCDPSLGDYGRFADSGEIAAHASRQKVTEIRAAEAAFPQENVDVLRLRE
jgi:hypothetical protein